MKVVELSPGTHRLRRARGRVRALPAGRGRLEALDALLGDGRAAGRRRRRSTWPGPARCCASGEFTVDRRPGRRWPSRARTWPRPPRPSCEARPGARFLPALRRANVHGALDMGLAPGVLPGRVALDDGPRLVRRPRGARCRPSGASTPPASSQAAADGRIDTLVLLGADPLADFPDRDLAARGLAGARTVIAVDPSSPTRRPRPTSCCRRPASPRWAAPPPTSRAGSACSARRSRRPAPPGPTG